jgi:hypothetical protein
MILFKQFDWLSCCHLTFRKIWYCLIKTCTIIRGRMWRPLTSLTLPHFCACPKPGPGDPIPYAGVFFMFTDLRWKVVVCFVDIGGIVDHHCLSFHQMRSPTLLFSWPVSVVKQSTIYHILNKVQSIIF